MFREVSGISIAKIVGCVEARVEFLCKAKNSVGTKRKLTIARDRYTEGSLHKEYSKGQSL